MVEAGGVEAVDGALLPMEVGSGRVHGDSPGATRSCPIEAETAVKAFA
jgi:lactam utilization protein B